MRRYSPVPGRAHCRHIEVFADRVLVSPLQVKGPPVDQRPLFVPASHRVHGNYLTKDSPRHNPNDWERNSRRLAVTIPASQQSSPSKNSEIPHDDGFVMIYVPIDGHGNPRPQGAHMNPEKLATKAREELNYYATKILERDFDDQNVALFLIYGRAAFDKEPALFDFANSVAHTRRDRDGFFKAADRANKLGGEDWLNVTNTEPLGTVGYTVAEINRELDSVMAALGRPSVSPAAAEEFIACLCAIGNHLEFVGKDSGLVGTTNALAVNGTLSLDLTPTTGLASVILLNAHLSTLTGGRIDYRDKRIHLKRDGPGAELRVVTG